MKAPISMLAVSSLLGLAFVAPEAGAQNRPESRRMMGGTHMMNADDARMSMMMGSAPIRGMTELAWMVPGAELRVNKQQDGVIMTITGKDRETVTNIRKLVEAKQLLYEAKQTMQMRGGRGMMMGNLRMTTGDIRNGAVIRVKADEPQQVQSLQKMAEAQALMWQVAQSRIAGQGRG